MTLFKYTILTIILLFSIPLRSFSQVSFQGTVLSKEREPIPYATLKFIGENNNQPLKVVISDSIGHFLIMFSDSIKVRNIKSIEVTYLKNKSTFKAIDLYKKPLEFILTDSMKLKNIIVQSPYTNKIIRQADRFIYIPNKEINEGATVLDILKITPLIQYDNKNDIFSIINKQGTLVYINNKKSELPKDMLISILRSTPANDIKNIEIITSPGSEYTANTSGGVININLKRNLNDGLSGNLLISTEQSPYNTSTLNGSINYRKNKLGIKLSPFLNNSFNYFTSEGEITQLLNILQYNNIRSYRRYQVFGGGIGIDYDISKKDLISYNGFISTVNGKSNQSNLTEYYTTSYTNKIIDSTFNSPVNGKDHYLYNFGNIYFQHIFNPLTNKQLTINIDYNQYSQYNNNYGEFNQNYPMIENMQKYKNILPQHFFNISERIDYSLEINKKSKLNFGGQMSNTNVTNDLEYMNWSFANDSYNKDLSLSNNYKYSENYIALYVSLTKKINDKINGIVGLRGEYTNYTTKNINQNINADSNYFNLFPNISLSYSPNSKHNFSISLLRKIKRPTIEQLFPGRTYFNNAYFSENNPFLQPVILYNFESMYSYSSNYYITLGYTHSSNQYSQFIISTTENQEDVLKKTYLNYGNSENFYLSFFTQQKLIRNFWDVNLSANANYTKFKTNSKNVILNNKNVRNLFYTFNINNTYYLSRKKKWVAFSLFKYYSPIEDISLHRSNILFSCDLGVRKTVNNLSISIYLTDIFNTYTKSIINYNTNSGYLSSNRDVKNNYTRSFSINIRYSFGNKSLKTNNYKKSANEEIKNRLNL